MALADSGYNAPEMKTFSASNVPCPQLQRTAAEFLWMFSRIRGGGGDHVQANAESSRIDRVYYDFFRDRRSRYPQCSESR
jgi:hypothetical protein